MTKIYLISPPQIELKVFSHSLKNALETNLAPVFQLRLKNYTNEEVIKIGKELKKICHDFNCLFFLNDSYKLALEIGADGAHLGAEDGSIKIARQHSPQNFLIGASCYDSRHLAMEAAEQGADYVSFGAFFPSKTKKSRGHPEPEILTWCDEVMNVQSVAIGGINDQNCGLLAKAGADLLAVISYVWEHPEGEKVAVKKLSEGIKATGC